MTRYSHLAHHIKALPPALKCMEELGYTAQACLEGTGVSESDLLNMDGAQPFSLAQEFRFHRNLLALTGDPLLGLKLGKAYTLQTYGLYGYAFLSSPTLRQALTIASNYGPLSFSLFNISFKVEGNEGVLRFSAHEAIPDDLLNYYVQRDLAAAAYGGEFSFPAPLVLRQVAVMRGDENQRKDYEAFFDCPIIFNSPHSELRIEASALDVPMPLRDAETSAVCLQQCQMLLARMSKSSDFVEKVRQLIIARPGYFPDIEYVSEKLNMTSRTLRRRLERQDSSFQEILTQLRYQLAQEYLQTSSLPLQEISTLLGYSSPGNFSLAFKRWHGSSPRAFRARSR